MNLRSIAISVFALGFVAACSEKPEPQDVNKSSVPANDTIPAPRLERPFSQEIDGECYSFLSVRNTLLKGETKPENLEIALNYFTTRVYKNSNINIDDPEFFSKALRIHSDYLSRIWDKYGMPNSNQEAEIHEPTCIAIAEIDLGLTPAP